MRQAIVLAAGLVLLLSGCVTNYHIFSGGEASCLEAIPLDGRAPAGYTQWLRYWQSTSYCQRVRARFHAALPDLIVEKIQGLEQRPETCPFRAGMQPTPSVFVKNQGRSNAPASDVFLSVTIRDRDDNLQLEMNYTAPVPPLIPGANHRVDLAAMNRPIPTVSGDRITFFAMADPLRAGPAGSGARGAVAESDEDNNTHEVRCSVN